MKLVSADGDRYVFRIGQRERALLSAMLRQYPLIPSGYHRYTRAGATGDDQANQALLDEALAAQRTENRGRVEQWLGDPHRFAPDALGFRFALSREEIEWLLQVLNELRLGNWIKAGCPDPEPGEAPTLTVDNAPFLLNMEVVGRFEVAILGAL